MRRQLATAGILACALALTACNDGSSAAPASSTPSATPKPSGTPAKKADTKPVDVQVRFIMLIDGPGANLVITPPKKSFTSVGTGKPSASADASADGDDTGTKTADTESADPTADSTDSTGATDSADPSTPDKPDTPDSDSAKPDTGSKVPPGEVTQYLPMQTGSVLSIGDTRLLDIPTSMTAGDKALVAIGTNADGKPEATGFVEKDGRITGAFGTSKPTDGQAPKDDKATVFGSGIGLGTSKDHKSVYLGVPDKGCLGDKDVSPKNHTAFPVTAGDVDLGWYSDSGCKTLIGDTKSVSLKAGQQGYVFAWSYNSSEFKLVFVPVEK